MTDEIRVTVRTAATGHMTLSLPLGDLPAWIDARLADGKAVVAESGAESRVIQLGRDILDFFLGRRRAGATPREEVTVLNPMRGGADVPMEVAAQVVAAAIQHGPDGRRGLGRDEAMAMPIRSSTTSFQAGAGAPGRLDPAAEVRAWEALREREGEGPAMALAAGGAVAVRSHLWPGVVYLVRVGTIQVIRDGQTVSNLCLQLADGGPVWDAVANRLSLLRAGEEGEIEVWAAAR